MKKMWWGNEKNIFHREDRLFSQHNKEQKTIIANSSSVFSVPFFSFPIEAFWADVFNRQNSQSLNTNRKGRLPNFFLFYVVTKRFLLVHNPNRKCDLFKLSSSTPPKENPSAAKFPTSATVSINVALHDGVESKSVDTSALHTNDVRLEEDFWASESFVSDGNNVTVGKLVLLFHVAGSFSFCHLFVEVESAVAKLFLDVTDDFLFSWGVEAVTTFHEDLLQVRSSQNPRPKSDFTGKRFLKEKLYKELGLFDFVMNSTKVSRERLS